MPTRYACPCCGYKTLPGRGDYDLCTVCFWEDDADELDDAVSLEGPNGQTLAEGQRTYARYGTSVLHCINKVRPPASDEPRDPDWEPLPQADVDSRQEFLEDFGQLLSVLLSESIDRARASRKETDVAHFEGSAGCVLALRRTR